MNEETLLLGNMIALILHPLYYCLFMINVKKIKDKKVYFMFLTIADYLIAQYVTKFRLGTNADLIYAIIFYINLKFIYKDKIRITDIATFILSDILLGVLSVIAYIIFGMNLVGLIFATITPIIVTKLLNDKLNIIDRFYNKYWNRKKNKTKVKSITVRGISLCATVIEFVAIHFWILYLLFN